MLANEKLLLLNLNGIFLKTYRNNGVTRLFKPRFHNGAHVKTARLFKRVPQISTLGIAISVSLKIGFKAVTQRVITHKRTHHNKQARTFGVHDSTVKNRIDFCRIFNHYVHRLHTIGCVAGKCQRRLRCLEGLPNFPRRLKRVDSHVLHHIGKRLIKPQVIPPFHGNKVAKPLVRKLVRNNVCHTLLVWQRAVVGVEQHVRLTIGNQTPVFHRTRRKIGQRNLVGMLKRIGCVVKIFVKVYAACCNVKGKVELFWLVCFG